MELSLHTAPQTLSTAPSFINFFALQYTLPYLLSTLFIILLSITFLVTSLTHSRLYAFSMYILKLFYFILILLSTMLFIVKFLLGYYLVNQITAPLTLHTNITSAVSLLPLFSDIIVLLCLFTTLIAWIFLSERYLTKQISNIAYFIVFFLFTINMAYTNNLLIMFLYFELLFLPSIYFVYTLGYSKKVDKTIKYLFFWTLTGSFIVLCGLSYIYGNYKTINSSLISQINFSPWEQKILYCVFFLGLGVKVPIWPFYYWLIRVHVEAPTGFSIFLSGFLVKTGLYCLLNFISLFYNETLYLYSFSLILIGASIASARMWVSTDIKRLIAFATIQEMNLLLMLFFLTTSSNLKLLTIFILVHGLLSALLFFLVDQVQKRYKVRNLVSITGVSQIFPYIHTVVWLALLIFRAFPLCIKFFIEWEIFLNLWVTFNYVGLCFFFFITLSGVLGFSRIWFSVLYGMPPRRNIIVLDMLKSDLTISVALISLLVVLNVLIFIF